MLACVWMVAMALATPSSGEILRNLERLQVVGSVLYVAAHPDDENTRLISWLVGDRGLRTAYLSMTRGGGGQNLIGREQGEYLGVVRTGELLAARAIDGGEQRFTRMRDFGYSKSAEETLRLWGHDEALEDVVRTIREFRPDVIVTRFSPEGGGHGHHTASAQLAVEAFTKAADPAYVIEDLEPWQATRILRNESTWRMREGEPIPDEWLRVDVGTFDPRTGRSYGEIAAQSRTMHKSQGFGSAPRPGSVLEYFSHLGGEPHREPFGGIDTSWGRLEGPVKIQRVLRNAVARFDPSAPHRILPLLAQAHTLLQEVPDAHWRELKTAELEAVMRDCVGWWATARAAVPAATGHTPEVPVTLTALVRAPVPVTIEAIRVPGFQPDEGAPLAPNVPFTLETAFRTRGSPHYALTQPFWLIEAPEPTRYVIETPTVRTAADLPAHEHVGIDLVVAGVRMHVEVPITYAHTDPVRGELVQDFAWAPFTTTTFDQRTLVIPTGRAAIARLTVARVHGPAPEEPMNIRLQVPEGFTATPDHLQVRFADDVLERTFEVSVTAEPGATPQVLTAGGRGRTVIDHPHLPVRTVYGPGEVRLVPVALDRGGVERVAYLQGSGDNVPDALRALGYDVTEIDEATIQAGALTGYHAVVLGVRAYNTRPDLPALHDALMDYVAGGGTLVVQYNTSRRWGRLSESIGPAPFDVGRGRVTDETAAVTFLAPTHRALSAPNRLGDPDFEGWVQERGLYFVSVWNEAYTPLLAMADPGEEPLEGSLLVARHGKGHFVYTGLSFFRQLPAGVPGATRLFANLLALGGR